MVFLTDRQFGGLIFNCTHMVWASVNKKGGSHEKAELYAS